MLQESTNDGDLAFNQPGREFAYTRQDFDCLRKMLKDRVGINLGDSKQDLAYGRLARIVRVRNLSKIGDYLEMVRGGDAEIISEFTNAMTTNVTSFFREPTQFEFMAKEYIPELLESNARSKKLRIWSSACSTGQEPYSISMVLKECLGHLDAWDARVLATDLDSEVLKTAKAGIYDLPTVEAMTKKRRSDWFKEGKGPNAGSVRVSPKLQEIIAFRQLNLMGEWPMCGPFDAIFCRNVVIYFDKETQRKLFSRMADLLGVGKCLFLGHAESLIGMDDRFELCSSHVYRKIR